MKLNLKSPSISVDRSIPGRHLHASQWARAYGRPIVRLGKQDLRNEDFRTPPVAQLQTCERREISNGLEILLLSFPSLFITHPWSTITGNAYYRSLWIPTAGGKWCSSRASKLAKRPYRYGSRKPSDAPGKSWLSVWRWYIKWIGFTLAFRSIFRASQQPSGN